MGQPVLLHIHPDSREPGNLAAQSKVDFHAFINQVHVYLRLEDQAKTEQYKLGSWTWISLYQIPYTKTAGIQS